MEEGLTLIDPQMMVVVPTGGGTRFHRPDGIGFIVACKTEFGQPVEEVPVSKARENGFTPCKKPACFGER